MTSYVLFFEQGITIMDLDSSVNLRELVEMGHLVADDEKTRAEVAYLVTQMFGQVSEELSEMNVLKALRRELSARPDTEQILAAMQAF
ncbi:MAG: hypothetical protein J2P36_35425 [Ktedonobacteraceae bacterium]|nr:hypothetical protein [Ktedonobacteraceae bacterium]